MTRGKSGNIGNAPSCPAAANRAGHLTPSQAMSNDYRPMWSQLGLDLDAHDALLSVLGRFYQDIYLAQNGRPEGMQYFDFVLL